MKGRKRIIDEHDLAALMRKAGKADWYEQYFNDEAKKLAKEKVIKGKTYHQYASSKDEILVYQYSLLDPEWKWLKEEKPSEGEETLFWVDNKPSKGNASGLYFGCYFPANGKSGELLVLADWDDDIGYIPRHIRNMNGIKWKSFSI